MKFEDWIAASAYFEKKGKPEKHHRDDFATYVKVMKFMKKFEEEKKKEEEEKKKKEKEKATKKPELNVVGLTMLFMALSPIIYFYLFSQIIRMIPR